MFRNFLSLIGIATCTLLLSSCESWPRYVYDKHLSEQFMAALKASRPCVEKHSHRKDGSVYFDIIVDETGSAQASKIASGTFGIPEIDECYLNNFKKLKLDPPPLKYSDDKVFISRKAVEIKFIDKN